MTFDVSRGSGIVHGGGLWPGDLLVPLALLLLTLGLWLLPRSLAALRTHAGGLLSSLRRQMLENRWGILLIPVSLLGLTVFGVQPWTVAAVLACAVTAVRWPVTAADLVPVALTAFAVRGFMIAASWPSLPGLQRPGLLYGFIVVTTRETAMLAGAEASAFLVVAAWLVPRTIGAHARAVLVPGRDLELEGRVQPPFPGLGGVGHGWLPDLLSASRNPRVSGAMARRPRWLLPRAARTGRSCRREPGQVGGGLAGQRGEVVVEQWPPGTRPSSVPVHCQGDGRGVAAASRPSAMRA